MHPSPGTEDPVATLRAIITDAAALARRLDDRGVDTGQAAPDLEAYLHADPDTVVVTFIGDTGGGKSSVVQALVGEPGLLPTGDVVTTNCRVRVHAGDRGAALEYDDGRPPQSIPLSAVDSYVRYVPGAPEPDMAQVAISLPHSLLLGPAGGPRRELIDNQGAHSVRPEHTDAAYRAAHGAQIVVMVLANESELDSALTKLLVGVVTGADTVLFVITKVDEAPHLLNRTVDRLHARLAVLRTTHPEVPDNIAGAPILPVDPRFAAGQGGRLRDPEGIEVLRWQIEARASRNRYLQSGIAKLVSRLERLRWAANRELRRLRDDTADSAGPADGGAAERAQAQELLLRSIDDAVNDAAKVVPARLDAFRMSKECQLLERRIGDMFVGGCTDVEIDGELHARLRPLTENLLTELMHRLDRNLATLDVRRPVSPSPDVATRPDVVLPVATSGSVASQTRHRAVGGQLDDAVLAASNAMLVARLATVAVGGGIGTLLGVLAFVVLRDRYVADRREQQQHTLRSQAPQFVQSVVPPTVDALEAVLLTTVEDVRRFAKDAAAELYARLDREHVHRTATLAASRQRRADQRDTDAAQVEAHLADITQLQQRFTDLLASLGRT